MRLNYDKCKVMHIGSMNKRAKYVMQDKETQRAHVLQSTELEKDLGVFISSDLKNYEQAKSASSKAMQMFGMLKSTFTNRDTDIWKKLYLTYIRPHLEFAAPVWNPYRVKDEELLEKVQHRATKVSFAMRGVPYEERCKRLGLTSLVDRRIRGDNIQKYKIEKGLDIVNWHHKQVIIPAMRGKRAREERESIKQCDQRHYFFSNRVLKTWNDLPNEIIDSTSTVAFKTNYDHNANQHRKRTGC